LSGMEQGIRTEYETVIHDLVGSIRKLVRAVYLDSQKMSKEYGLTGPQSSVLRILGNKGPTSSAELSRILYVTPSNITGIIDRLQKKGLVNRIKKEGDRRVALITLTEEGAALCHAVPDPVERKFIAALADLKPEHVQILGTAMKHILGRIDIDEMDATPLEINHEL
jgi:DNA-binding MarR family transcriptional regulator